MADYPQHEKLRAIRDQSQTIYDFLEWGQEQGWHLAEWDTTRKVDDRMMPIQPRTDQVLAKYFGIDLMALEAEKRAMLDEMRAANG